MTADLLQSSQCRGCARQVEIMLPANAAIASAACAGCGATVYASHYQRIDIGLSEVCNLSCNMCRRPQEKAFLDFGVISRMLQDASAIGVGTVSFSGGEPFVHPRFRDILRLALAHDFDVELVTNGTLVRADDAALLRQLKCITVSIDGPRDIHDHIRGMVGAWDKSMATLALLNRIGAKWGTNTVIQGMNAHALLDTWHAIHAAGHPAYIGFTHVEVVPETRHLQPDAEDAGQAKRQLATIRAECAAAKVHFNDDAIMTGMYDVFSDKTKRYRPPGGCRIPQLFLGISSHGIYPCWHQGRALPGESLIAALESDLCRDIVAEARGSRCIGCNAANYSWSDEWVAGIFAASTRDSWSDGVVYLAETERRAGHLTRGKRTLPLLERQKRGNA
jgi:MoaA/NifB/PqqE/SkfB family radical SAM enzyme